MRSEPLATGPLSEDERAEVAALPSHELYLLTKMVPSGTPRSREVNDLYHECIRREIAAGRGHMSVNRSHSAAPPLDTWPPLSERRLRRLAERLCDEAIEEMEAIADRTFHEETFEALAELIQPEIENAVLAAAQSLDVEGTDAT